MKVADPRAAGRHIFICDFCGQSSLGDNALVLAGNGQSCICGTCAATAAEICAKADTKPTPQPQEPGHV